MVVVVAILLAPGVRAKVDEGRKKEGRRGVSGLYVIARSCASLPKDLVRRGAVTTSKQVPKIELSLS